MGIIFMMFAILLIAYFFFGNTPVVFHWSSRFHTLASPFRVCRFDMEPYLPGIVATCPVLFLQSSGRFQRRYSEYFRRLEIFHGAVCGVVWDIVGDRIEIKVK